MSRQAKMAREQTSLFQGLLDDGFIRHDDFIYGSNGIVEHRVTFSRPAECEEQGPSCGASNRHTIQGGPKK